MASPFKSNQHGHFVSYNLDTSRRKRTVDDDESSYYKVNVFGKNIHMKLVPNQNLMGRDILVETHHNGGRVTSELLPRTASHYIGNINDDLNSVVAVTKDDQGLVRKKKINPKNILSLVAGWNRASFSAKVLIISLKK